MPFDSMTIYFSSTFLLYSGNSCDVIVHFLIIAIAVFSILIVDTKLRKLSHLYLFQQVYCVLYYTIPYVIENIESIKAWFFPTER